MLKQVDLQHPVIALTMMVNLASFITSSLQYWYNIPTVWSMLACFYSYCFRRAEVQVIGKSGPEASEQIDAYTSSSL